MLGADESSIAGVASPLNYILHEETTDKFLMSSQTLRIESDVPVTLQRYDDINYVVATGPISEGAGVILVTSNCDTGATEVVPTVEIANDGNATVVTVKLVVPEGGALEMPFLTSSSYEAVFYENSYIQYTAADIQPEDPIVKYVPCMTETDCRKACLERDIQSFEVGEYATNGCFYKNNKAYWSTIGDPAEGAVAGIQQRVWCKEVHYIDDIAVDSEVETCANATRSDWNWESRHSFRERSSPRDASRRRGITDWSRIGAKAAPPKKCRALTCPASRRGLCVRETSLHHLWIPSARAGPWQTLPNLARVVSSASWMSGSAIPRTESSPVHVR
jgi:hypothetical protein